ncbi:unnamed protein product [Moneuplotes crassus]|uniref:Uncharacterized protein n=1 Tax=Euplotes crassus TaxID=5936 RepID=A0AAD2DAF0_EUPCR|nr:unnamed protein product [Moneuplotes crassus]
MDKYGDSEFARDLRFKDEQKRFLEQCKWGYNIDIDNEESMIIPARELFPTCVNILKKQLCQLCDKKPIVVKAIMPLEHSSNDEWNHKMYFCKSCAKKIQPELEIETMAKSGVFCDPIKQLNQGFLMIRKAIFKRQLYLAHILRTKPYMREQIETVWKQSEQFYGVYQNILNRVYLAKGEPLDIQSKKIRNFIENQSTYKKIIDDVNRLLININRDPKFKKLAKDSEVKTQAYLQKELYEIEESHENTIEESKQKYFELKNKSIDLVWSLQSLQEAFTTQDQIREHYPNVLDLKHEYADSYFDAKRKYSVDLEKMCGCERRISDYLELNMSSFIPQKRFSLHTEYFRSKTEQPSFFINCQLLWERRQEESDFAEKHIKTSKEQQESIDNFQKLTEDHSGKINTIEISFCSFGIREIIKIFRNPFITSVENLMLNLTDRELYPKLTPVFCKYLSQFIETKVKKSISISHFQLHTAQVNLILKAARNLKHISVTKCSFLDQGIVKLNFKEFYLKDISTYREEFDVIERLLPLKELKICNNYQGDMNKNDGDPCLKDLKQINKSQFDRLCKDLQKHMDPCDLPKVSIDRAFSVAEVRHSNKQDNKTKAKKKEKIDFYQKDQGSNHNSSIKDHLSIIK